MSKSLAVIFPGIGYHTDKPLLYYSKKLAKQKGYEVLDVKYTFEEDFAAIKGDEQKMLNAFDSAFEQVTQSLKEVDFKEYDRVVFIGKSIGTAIAARYNMTFELDADLIVFTPIEATFAFMGPCEAFVFHGNADPLCDTDMCVQLCEEMSLTYIVVPDANHSLETGDVLADINNLGHIMNTVEKLL